MNTAIKKQLLFESKFTGWPVLVVQIELPENDPIPSEVVVKNTWQFVAGWLDARGGETGAPILRTSGRTVEIALCVPAGILSDFHDLFSALERTGASFRAGKSCTDGSFETIYPIECTETFSLLPDPLSVQETCALLEREFNALKARSARLSELVDAGRISESTAAAQLAHIEERREALEESVARLRAMEGEAQ